MSRVSLLHKTGRFPMGTKRVRAAAAVGGGLAVAGAAPSQAAEKVTYQLPAAAFLPAFGPWMVAVQRGYYAKEDLDVTFESGRGGVDTAKAVGGGNAQIRGGLRGPPDLVPRQGRARESGRGPGRRHVRH